MQYSMRSIAANALRKIGLARYRPSPTALETALARSLHHNLGLNTLIDIGASNGCWAKTAQKFYPDLSCYLVEANPFHQKSLEAFKRENKKIDFIIAAASDTVGEVYFDGSDPFSGLASHQAFEQATYKIPAVTIDSICQQEKLVPPYLIKLDTHGFEIPIFEGAKEALKHTNLIVVEVYNFNLTDDSLRFPQLCQYLEDRGFQCIDMCDPMFREKDGALWQFDLFFVPKQNSIFLDNSWS
jgi:FkbM family methyltransferase